MLSTLSLHVTVTDSRLASNAVFNSLFDGASTHRTIYPLLDARSDPNVVNFCGAGQMIKGFDAAVADMEVGQIIDVHLMPEEAYGMADPNAIFTMEISQLPGSEDLTVGQQVYLSNQYGQPFPVKVTAKDNKNITFDANHEMAGKELNFKIELVEVK